MPRCQSAQKSILDNVLMSYYHQYFNSGTRWYEHKDLGGTHSLSKQIQHPRGRHLFQILRSQSNGQYNYYDILGIAFDAGSDEIKEAFRKLAIEYHPDKILNNPNYDSEKFYKVYEAYETLNDEDNKNLQ